MPAGAPRKHPSDLRSRMLQVRMSRIELQIVAANAKKHGMNVSDYVRATAMNPIGVAFQTIHGVDDMKKPKPKGKPPKGC